jgi:hypothetical protein
MWPSPFFVKSKAKLKPCSEVAQKCGILCIVVFGKLQKVNTHTMDENWPNLVTLPGTDVMISKIFSPKTFGEKMALLAQSKAK